MSPSTGAATRVRELSLSKPLRAERADIDLVLEQFGSTGTTRTEAGSSYVYLDRLLLGSSASERDAHLRALSSILSQWLGETSLHELALAFAALTAIQLTDIQSAVAIYEQDGMRSRLQEAAEIVTMEQKLVDKSEYAQAKIHLALFAAQAAGHSKTASLAEMLASVADNWLKHAASRKDEDKIVRAASLLTNVKLEAVNSTKPSQAGEDFRASPLDVATVQELLKEVGTDEDSPLAPTLLETTSVATLRASGRQAIAARPELIKAILACTSTVHTQFGAASTLRNLTSYCQSLSEEERTTAQIKRYANSGGKTTEEDEEANDVVDQRNKRLLVAGVVPSMLPLCKANSPSVRSLAGSILHNMVRSKATRPTVIQQGGARMLLAIALQAKGEGNAPAAGDASEAAQALAKLLITANPATVFGSGTSGLENAIPPLAALCTSSSSALLQRFEAFMALTNLASISEALADRIAQANGLLEAIDETLLANGTAFASEGQTLCRRAAAELLCNLAVTDTAFLRYTAADQADSLVNGKLPASVSARLQVVLALTEVEDLPTRQATLASLSQFTCAPTVCSWLSVVDKRFNTIAAAVEDDDAGMQLRAIACLGNLAKECADRREAIRALLRQTSQVSDEQETRLVAQNVLESI